MKELRRAIIEAAYSAQEGHIPSAFSILDILWVLYDEILTSDDRFVLSKGHGSLALYAVLAEKGIIPREWLKSFASYDSPLGGHPHLKVPGVEASTGSLGHGLPIAAGMALAKKIRGEPGRIYCLIGDGEANEGSVWETALFAAHHALDNLICIVDNNRSSERAIDMGSIANKFHAFEWSVLEVDGHHHGYLHGTLCERLQDAWGGQPIAVLASTMKGYGCKLIENNPEWHHKSPSAANLDALIEALT